MDFEDKFSPGTIVQRTVVWPGPKCDDALVVRCLGPGHHVIRFQLWGEGDWFERETRSALYAPAHWPEQVDAHQVARLKEEWRRIQAGRR